MVFAQLILLRILYVTVYLISLHQLSWRKKMDSKKNPDSNRGGCIQNSIENRCGKLGYRLMSTYVRVWWLRFRMQMPMHFLTELSIKLCHVCIISVDLVVSTNFSRYIIKYTAEMGWKIIYQRIRWYDSLNEYIICCERRRSASNTRIPHSGSIFRSKWALIIIKLEGYSLMHSR